MTDIFQTLLEHDQSHLLFGLDSIDTSERIHFLDEVRRLDFQRMKTEHGRAGAKSKLPPLEKMEIIPKPDPAGCDNARRLGEQSLSLGEVAVVLVAGGRGSRLGFEKPKGMYPIGPVSKSSLFRIHAEKILARRRRHGGRIPLLIMTSNATHEETIAYFEQEQYFDLPKGDVRFFRQGTMPVMASDRFRLLLDAPGKLCRSPNGHGGTLPALHDSGLLDEMHAAGVKHLYYFQVDNPLTKIVDPVFIGQHIQAESEASSKVVPKAKPTDKMGNLVLIDGRCSIIEYNEPDENEVWAKKGDRYLFLDGNPAIHLFSVSFFRRLIDERFRFPWHSAKKKVEHLDDQGNRVKPTSENAVQLETFIFDTLPEARRWLAVETTHAEEFAPLKNADSDPTDNPTSVRRAMSDLARKWLQAAGMEFANDECAAEISALMALEPDDVLRKLKGNMTIHGTAYFGG